MKITVNPNAFEKQLQIRSVEEANEAALRQIGELRQRNAELEKRGSGNELCVKELLRTTNLTSTELLLLEAENNGRERQLLQLEQHTRELNEAAEEYRIKKLAVERELDRAMEL